MNPFQRYRAAPITPITFSGEPYHTWSCRFQLTSRLLPNRPNPSSLHLYVCHSKLIRIQAHKHSGRLGRRPPPGGRSRQQTLLTVGGIQELGYTNRFEVIRFAVRRR